MSKQALRRDLQLVAELVPTGTRVLDLGCGSGELLSYLLSDKNCTGTGVERDNDSLLGAIRRAVPVLALDLDEQLDQFASDSYDVVVLSRTLQAVLHPTKVLREMSRIAPRLVVTMPNFGYWRNRMTLLSGHMPRSRDLPFAWYDTPNLHHSTLVDLEKFFAKENLTISKRILLTDSGERLAAGRLVPNLWAGSAIYVLGRQ